MWSGNSSSAIANEMFMTHMGTDSDIAEKTFSFYLTGLSGQSYIDFGTPNSAVMNGSVTYISILSDNPWWTSDLTGFRFSGESEYAITTGSYSITDTGSSCIIGPAAEADRILKLIVTRLPKIYEQDGWGYIFECPANYNDLPKFEFLYGGYWMEVLPEDYIIDVSNNGSWCSVCISSVAGFDEWILGDAFMRGWYNIHDHDNLRMGFVPFVGSSKSAPETATSTPSETIPDITLVNVGTLIFGLDSFTFFVLLFTFLLAASICTCCAVYLFMGGFAMSATNRGKSILEKTAKKSAILMGASNAVHDEDSQISLIVLE